MKRIILSIFAASLFFGNFCPMRAMHVQAAEMPITSHAHATLATSQEPCPQEEPVHTLTSATCAGNACFLDEYVADQKSSSAAKQATEPIAFAGIIPSGALMDTPMDFPMSVIPPGKSPPLLAHITTIVLRT